MTGPACGSTRRAVLSCTSATSRCFRRGSQAKPFGREPTATSRRTVVNTASITQHEQCQACDNGKGERDVRKRKDGCTRRHALPLFFSCAASLRLSWFAGELRIERVIDEPPSFQGGQITRTDQAKTLTDDVQTSRRGF